MINNLLKIFKVKSFFQLSIVFLVFAITGSLSVILGEYFINFFFGDFFGHGLIYWVLRILLIFPLYQVLLIIIGTLFGEFNYFWKFTKKILEKIKIIS